MPRNLAPTVRLDFIRLTMPPNIATHVYLGGQQIMLQDLLKQSVLDPACEQHFYCNWDIPSNCDDQGSDDQADCQMKYVKPCKSCDECSIAEYTDGTGAKSPSKCMTLSAIFGFGYPTQCSILWIIIGGIVCMVCTGWGVKCYLHGGGEIVITGGDGKTCCSICGKLECNCAKASLF